MGSELKQLKNSTSQSSVASKPKYVGKNNVDITCQAIRKTANCYQNPWAKIV